MSERIHLGESVYYEFEEGKIKLTTERGYGVRAYGDVVSTIYLRKKAALALLKITTERYGETED